MKYVHIEESYRPQLKKEKALDYIVSNSPAESIIHPCYKNGWLLFALHAFSIKTEKITRIKNKNIKPIMGEI
ncbi:hypothetical protein DPMN_174380 [Dreissena polymorpha]|uniref:Uncharacterized protein n=1 Tax=Dreissena polymorpha TaxID=45954 RepID=A0A9D4IF34_DREPO|nr:hypothetical protein DPMN_174380 [Dreissena polymorpha]